MDLNDDLRCFLDWEEVQDALSQRSWESILATRRAGPPVTVFTRYDGRLALHESELTPSERAELCRWGFVPMTSPHGGRFWCWAPPSAVRQHRPGAGQIRRSGEIAWACALQRDRKVIRLLRDLLGAEPQALTVVLEPEDEELAV